MTATEGRQAALLQAMPAVFVLIWSTGFVVARYGMPHAPPMSFLALRYACRVLAFAVWISGARRLAAQWHAVVAPGGDRRADARRLPGRRLDRVKGGLGAGLAALIVGLQPC
jgi:drug/metabolite transporter (DMT)-like permease